VVPAYRAEGFLERAVRSVLVQSWADWELVIASDDAVDYVAQLRGRGLEDPRFRCVFTGGTGTGPAHARNVGLDAAAADVVAMLDADDCLAPSALEVLVPLAQQHGASYSAQRMVDHATNQELPSYDRPLATGLVTLEDLLSSVVHSYAGIVFDRRRMGARWPESRERWEDVTFFVRCFDCLEWVAHVSEPLYVYYKRDGSICNRPETGSEYHDAAAELLDRMERGDTLGVVSGAARKTYQRYLRGRLALEAAFLEDLAAGRCVDYRDFMVKNLPSYYRLP
jgi:glycosyltransferase involved in cell wall biosynthesis